MHYNNRLGQKPNAADAFDKVSMLKTAIHDASGNVRQDKATQEAATIEGKLAAALGLLQAADMFQLRNAVELIPSCEAW